MGVGVVLDQGFEVNIKVWKNPRQKSHVCRQIDLDFSADKLGEEIAPAAVSKEKQDSLRSVSVGQLQRDVQFGILMVSVETIVD
jgi:hypothetical protein